MLFMIITHTQKWNQVKTASIKPHYIKLFGHSVLILYHWVKTNNIKYFSISKYVGRVQTF